MNFLEYVTLNPKVSLEKGKIYPFIEMSDVSTCSRNPINIKYKSFDSGVKFEDGDTVIARITPCLQNGKRFYCKDIGKGFGSTEYLVFRPKNNSVDNLYLYYVLSTDFVKESMVKSMVGATGRQRVNNEVFSRLEMEFPDIDTQRRIASTLSAYDELIENNKKQIKLLEEAAQRLYKEWFIDLHEGWKEGTLGDIAEFKRGKTITKADVTEGPIPVVAGGLEPAYYHNKANTTAPVITVSGSGANAGFARLYNENVFASDCSFADSTTTPYIFFVYCFLRANKSSLDSLQKGAAQPHVYAKDINNMKLLIPTNIEMGSFCGFVSPYFKKMKTLQIQINKLTQARERLLPKLMSGEIEV